MRCSHMQCGGMAICGISVALAIAIVISVLYSYGYTVMCFSTVHHAHHTATDTASFSTISSTKSGTVRHNIAYYLDTVCYDVM